MFESLNTCSWENVSPNSGDRTLSTFVVGRALVIDLCRRAASLRRVTKSNVHSYPRREQLVQTLELEKFDGTVLITQRRFALRQASQLEFWRRFDSMDQTDGEDSRNYVVMGASWDKASRKMTATSRRPRMSDSICRRCNYLIREALRDVSPTCWA